MSMPYTLTPEALEEIDRQVEHIAAMGGKWKPNADGLRGVAEAVLAAQRKSWKNSQMKGIESANKRGVTFGRPRKTIPKDFEKVYEQWKNGEFPRLEAGKRLGVSTTTFDKWVKEWRLLYESEKPSETGESETSKDS